MNYRIETIPHWTSEATMPHDLIDNQSIKRIDAIQQTLPGSAAAHFAVGCCFLSGLEAVAAA